ncbi:MAG: hypothetical protein A2Y58_06140 [Chloroflexi bacterium RBG_13_51_52]|nr:MAG: hypothetical protein A2Y58_06140 [Chloroflexi bacterium RBG_13_51_52]
MFGDLDKSLENLLKQNLAPDLVKSVAISFDPPDSKFPPAWIKLPAINLFLYTALENLELRNTEWMWEKGKADTGSVKKPQVQIECSYIITAWTSDSSPNHMLEEHRLLGQAMKSLLKGRTFPRDSLYGSLKDGTATIIRAVALQPEHFSMGPFWQAMGVKPRVAVNYQITLSVDIHTPEKTKEVRERELKLVNSRGSENIGERIRFDSSVQPDG